MDNCVSIFAFAFLGLVSVSFLVPDGWAGGTGDGGRDVPLPQDPG